jgi:hypothetical protein
MKSNLFFILTCLLFNTLTAATTLAMPLEIGGSNYVIWSRGDYSASNLGAWYDSVHGVRPVIGTYHLKPKLVEQQLRNLYKSGQRKIALVLWFEAVREDAPYHIHGHLVDSSLSKLRDQHEKNLRAVLKLINKIGFTQLYFRFAMNGLSDPAVGPGVSWSSWSKGWNEAGYQQNFKFLMSTRSVVEEELKNTAVRRMYDLGVELGGIESGQAVPYQKRLWSDYIKATKGDISDTYGFSIAHATNRLSKLINLLMSVGKIPKSFATDIYPRPGYSMSTALSEVRGELDRNGLSGREIILQETFANDPSVYQGVAEARAFGLNLTTIMQWPLQAGLGDVHFSNLDVLNHFNNYLPAESKTPSIQSSGFGCVDQQCLWILGRNFTHETKIKIYSANKKYLGSIAQPNFRLSNNEKQSQLITLRLPVAASASKGLYYSLENGTALSKMVFLKAPGK